MHRLYHERYRKPSWKPPHPEHSRITDEQVKKIIELFKPVCLIAIYRKNVQDRSAATQALSCLCEIDASAILPDVTERLYASLDVLHEPHRLVFTIQAMNACMKKLMDWDKGRQHILPLMQSLLPAIDPNDYRKTLVALNLMM